MGMNGWYHRREDPPTRGYFASRRDKWNDCTHGRPWYESDSGCLIYWYHRHQGPTGTWFCSDITGGDIYSTECPVTDPHPPTTGWEIISGNYDPARAPAPTLEA